MFHWACEKKDKAAVIMNSYFLQFFFFYKNKRDALRETCEKENHGSLKRWKYISLNTCKRNIDLTKFVWKKDTFH